MTDITIRKDRPLALFLGALFKTIIVDNTIKNVSDNDFAKIISLTNAHNDTEQDKIKAIKLISDVIGANKNNKWLDQFVIDETYTSLSTHRKFDSTIGYDINVWFTRFTNKRKIFSSLSANNDFANGITYRNLIDEFINIVKPGFGGLEFDTLEVEINDKSISVSAVKIENKFTFFVDWI